MSGHSKFANIKHKKEKNDAAKGKIFTKIGRELAVAVKEGGGADPANNSRLRDVIAKAKANNMPNDNIERSIKKAIGDADASNYEHITYEGYGPAGSAVIVRCLTDNKNRTAADVRHVFDKAGGNLGTSGCVSYMFNKKGVIVIDKETTSLDFYYNYGIGEETGRNAIVDQAYTVEKRLSPSKKTVNYYKYKLDTYNAVGVEFKDVTAEQLKAIQEYQDRTGIQVIYPATSLYLRPSATQDSGDANYWYETKAVEGKTVFEVNENKPISENYVNIYYKILTEEEIYAYVATLPESTKNNANFRENITSDLLDILEKGDGGYNSLRIEGDDALYYYARPTASGYEIRVDYYEYYRYYHSEVLKDGIEYPSFLFGTTDSGQDIFACLANGARFSFILAILVASINLFVGAIYGAIEGYYGGKIDIIMERFVDILSAVPFMVVISLLKYHMENSSQLLILFIAFFLTGWMGMAGRTRMQFYRFKNQEYVLVARTLALIVSLV